MNTMIWLHLKSSKRFMGISLVVLLLFGLLTFNLVLNKNQNEIIEELDKAEFVVTKIDILNASSSSVFASGSAKITGLNKSVVDIKIEQLDIAINNNSEFLPLISIPLSNQKLDSEILFELELVINNDISNDLPIKILSNILIGNNFTLNFQATVAYKIGVFRNLISFSNILHFRLDQDSVNIVLEEIFLMEKDQLENFITFNLFNPFSASMRLSGKVEIELNGTKLGWLNLERRVFVKGITKVKENFNLELVKKDLYQEVLSSTQLPIILNTNLKLEIGALMINISPVLELVLAETFFDFNITAINSLILNLTSNSLYVNASASFYSFIPISLDLIKFNSEVYTLSNIRIGNLTWESSKPILVKANNFTLFDGVELELQAITFPNFSEILLQGSIRLKQVKIVLFIDGIAFEFSISNQSIQVIGQSFALLF